MTAERVVAILTEAGRGVGLGHLRRCQALAAALDTGGAAVEIAVAGEGWGPATATPLDWLGDPASLRAWLDARRPDAVVVDSYGASEGLLRGLRARVLCVAVVDDLADRALPASIVVNGSWHAGRLAYRTDADTLKLLGPQYALLDPAYADRAIRPPAATVGRVLVSFGGDADTAGALMDAVAAVRRAVPGAVIDVAATAAGHFDGDDAITVHRGLPSLRGLIGHADLVVSGGGMTLYECLAAGVPVVATVLADNQRPNVTEMARAGLIVTAEPSVGAAVGRVASDAGLRRALSAGGRAAVDGRGARRVADAIGRAAAAPAGGDRVVGLADGAR
jgi:UDP-2,4-diacetamido-2,4,6-trideoxy-beta-L-altropyranose hydrolase